jgi:hypothetical protein
LRRRDIGWDMTHKKSSNLCHSWMSILLLFPVNRMLPSTRLRLSQNVMNPVAIFSQHLYRPKGLVMAVSIYHPQKVAHLPAITIENGAVACVTFLSSMRSSRAAKKVRSWIYNGPDGRKVYWLDAQGRLSQPLHQSPSRANAPKPHRSSPSDSPMILAVHLPQDAPLVATPAPILDTIEWDSVSSLELSLGIDRSFEAMLDLQGSVPTSMTACKLRSSCPMTCW